ncbi:hypothetical protein F6B41_00230 [Microbacterium lushaniae]|nr:hypothetical protein F6B41_00705 [Microbacterium lushaniae]KAA9159869.1 hypothetical protein F6B41_00230 [Microbacterium lushaniae]
MFKSAVKKVVPKPLFEWVYVQQQRSRTRREFRKDSRGYLANATSADRVFTVMSQSHIETQTNKDYHRVEKALTLGSPKRPFGAGLGKRLDTLIPLLESNSDLVDTAKSAKAALTRWNQYGEIDDAVSPLPPVYEPMPRDVLSAFFQSRHSVRHFDDTKEVPREVLMFAAELAGRSPSVCNRQAWRVRFATESATKANLLRHQSGNRGFGHIPVVALVTVDVRRFAGPGERNQAWIDAGLFSMSLVLALHGVGVSSCMLNMSVRNSTADALKSEFGIPPHELIVMQIALGYAAEGHRVARSPRRPVSEVALFLDE